MGSRSNSGNPHTGDGASPGKIFIGGLAKDTTYATFAKHFGKYGDIVDSVIMKDRFTGAPRGFGFITYNDPSVVDKVIEDIHVINGKQVEIKRTIPKGQGQSKDFKTKKIFVGGIPSAVPEEELKSFFSKYGEVVEHQIIQDHETNRSRGFGFVIFDSEEVVDELLSKGNMIDMDGTQVEIKKAEPKKSSNPPHAPAYGSNSRARSLNDGFGPYGSSYGGFDGGFGPGPYRTPGAIGGSRYGGGGGYGYGYGGDTGEFGAGYGSFGNSSLGGYRGDSSFGYNSRMGPYGSGYGGGYGASGLGGYGRGGESYGSGNYGSSSYGGGYDTGAGGTYSGAGGAGGAGGTYGRGGYNSNSRYHPYAR